MSEHHIPAGEVVAVENIDRRKALTTIASISAVAASGMTLAVPRAHAAEMPETAPASQIEASAAIPAEHPVDKVRRLGKELGVALDEYDEGRWFAKVYPAKTGSWLWFGNIEGLEGPRPDPDAEIFRLEHKMEAAHARMREAAARCEAIDKRNGGKLDAEMQVAETVFDCLCREHFDLGRQIFAVPANTFRGLAVKVWAGERMLLGEFADEDEGFVSIAADIKRLAGAGAS